MFFARLSEEMGLFDFLAPRKSEQKKKQEQREKEKNELESSMEMQRAKELDAERRNAFAVNQRVRYFHKSSNAWYDAYVAGVHLDDGPDKPYYVRHFDLFSDILGL
jgi:hypothetical protein